MEYELHILTASEQVLIHPLDDVIQADDLIPLFGNRLSEVKSLTLVAKTLSGDVVLHQQTFN